VNVMVVFVVGGVFRFFGIMLIKVASKTNDCENVN